MLVVTLVDDKGLRHSPATLLKGRARRAVTSVVTALSAMDQGSVEAPYHYAETNTDSGKPDSNWRPQVPQTCTLADSILCNLTYVDISLYGKAIYKYTTFSMLMQLDPYS